MAGWTVRSLQRDFVGSNSTGCTHRVGPTGMVELDIVAGEAAAGAALLWDVLTGRTHSMGCELEGGVIGYGSVWPHAGKRCMHIYMYVQLLRPGRATPKDNSSFFRREKELPQVGFEPATFCVLGWTSRIFNVIQGQRCLFPDKQGNSIQFMYIFIAR